MKRGLGMVGWCLSPTRKIVDLLLANSDAPEGKARILRCWNRSFFCIDLVLCLMLFSFPIPNLAKWVPWLILVLPWSRCNEIFYAFYRDAFDRLAQGTPNSSLKPADRIRLAMKSYLGLVVNFALFYYFVPVAGAFNRPLTGFLDAIYFSGVTITTLGYGEVHPIHWSTKAAALYEAFSGILLVAVAVAIYVGAVGESNGDSTASATAPESE